MTVLIDNTEQKHKWHYKILEYQVKWLGTSTGKRKKMLESTFDNYHVGQSILYIIYYPEVRYPITKLIPSCHVYEGVGFLTLRPFLMQLLPNRWILTYGDDPPLNEEQQAFKPTLDHTNGDSSSYYAFTSASEGEYKHTTDLISALAIGESVFSPQYILIKEIKQGKVLLLLFVWKKV